jgi:uncharacterized protein (DUF433 family)
MSTAAATGLIRKTPGVCGGEACIGNRRIAVWMLVQARKLGIDDGKLQNRYEPPLTADELQAAWGYYTLHHDEIEAAIQRNEAA